MTVPNTDQITQFIHCGKCLKELPVGTSPKDWARLNVGFTPKGMQVWCVRHDCNILNVDFEGQTHPANTSALNPSVN